MRRILRLMSLAVLFAGATHPLNASSSTSTTGSRRARPVAPDSIEQHRTLVKAIEKFQDRWRSVWQRAEIKRHRPINLSKIRGWVVNRNGAIAEPFFVGDREAMLLTPELRRYLSMLCFVDSPSDRQIELAKARVQGDIGVSLTRAPRIDIGQPTRRSRTPIPVEPVRQRPTQPNEPVSGGVTWAMQRIIRDPAGSVCPAWVPDDEASHEESESIDHALPPEQRTAIARERETLIELLARARTNSPRDDWIVGQYVRFVLDQNTPTRTVDAARECRSTRVWCLELLGLALERADSAGAADSVFRLADRLRMEEAGPAATACIDTDVLPLLPPEERSTILAMPCVDQRRFTETMWWLADPLWSIEGNERYVAHRARQTHATLRATLSRDERYVWAASAGRAAQRELVIRYGWPSYTYWPGGPFEEELSVLRETNARIWTPAPPYSAREYQRDRQAFIPTMTASTPPWQLVTDNWQTTAPRNTSFDAWWPREHAASATQLTALPAGQDVQWRRDSTVLYAIAVNVPRTENDRRELDAVLVTSTGPTDVRAVTQVRAANGKPIRASANLAAVPQMIGIEARVPSRPQRGAGNDSVTGEGWLRARFGLIPPPALNDMAARSLAISSPVFVTLADSTADVPTIPERVIADMASSLTFERSMRVGVYWEAYGFAVGDTIDVRLTIARDESSSGVRRAGERLGLVGERRDSVVIAWREPDQRSGMRVPTELMTTTSRAVALALRELPLGAYRLLIEMRLPDGRSARSERAFQLRE
ncbi:MAG: hypothetical protein IT353_08825 [Gemmatimonadaceae bacterium]|nr:hypothetical protein [Gemmatimonadaceae bacterium]